MDSQTPITDALFAVHLCADPSYTELYRVATDFERDRADLIAALEACVTTAGSYCMTGGRARVTAKERRLFAINDTARAALAKVRP